MKITTERQSLEQAIGEAITFSIKHDEIAHLVVDEDEAAEAMRALVAKSDDYCALDETDGHFVDAWGVTEAGEWRINARWM